MRKRAVAASVLASFGILTVAWQVGAATAPATVSTGGATSTGTSSGTTTGTSSGTTVSAGLKDGTYTGTDEQTRFGDVQVSVTISGGKISEVKALHLTDAEGRSIQISNYAAPILRQEVISAQSSQVSNVSGATYTTDAYLSSVQSALDQAKA